MQFSNKVYDTLKFIVLIGLPAFAAFYLGLSQVWGFPEPEKVGTSIGLLAAFLGALLQISNSKYKSDNPGDPGDPQGELKFVGNDPDTGIPEIQLTVFPDVAADPAAALNKGELKLTVTSTDNFVPQKMALDVDEDEEH